MYRPVSITPTSIEVYEAVEGETIEAKMERITSNREPIEEPGVQLIYTERNEGVIDAYNPRTDKMEIAIEAMDKVATNQVAKRASAKNGKTEDHKTTTEGGETPSNSATSSGANTEV